MEDTAPAWTFSVAPAPHVGLFFTSLALSLSQSKLAESTARVNGKQPGQHMKYTSKE